MIEASAAGKAILFGEHAVVYDQPALAIPLPDLRTFASIRPIEAEQASFHIIAEDLAQSFWLYEVADRNPLAYAIHQFLGATGVVPSAPLEIRIHSTLPIAAGLGSGAAASIAILRALAGYFRLRLDDATISALAYEVEKLHHGTPSGIDNTVIAFEFPVYFKSGEYPRKVALAQPLNLVLGHCGVVSQTGQVVSAVRERWQANQEAYDALFTSIGELVERAYQALITGQLQLLGSLMDKNHTLLQQIGVSTPELDRFVNLAKSAGALGAKLSGAGAGGFMLALVDQTSMEPVAKALENNDARHTFKITVPA